MTDAFQPRCYALVPAAGTGTRAGTAGPKQYQPIAGRALIAHALDALLAVPRIDAVLVVLAPDDAGFDAAVPGYAGERGWRAAVGGATRAASVRAGLDALLARGARAGDWVLVHDAARCLLRREWVERLIDACAGDAVGGLLALPLADTLKQSANGRSTATLAREGKWIAQTPQMFRIGRLREALAAAGDGVTDEASAIEALGDAPLLVPGDSQNLKVTWPGDLRIAEALLAARSAR